ncbi:MAG: TlpA family protein disulfide reductase, partial [Planctomycetales bacterium]
LDAAGLVEYLDKMKGKPKTIQRRNQFQEALADAAGRLLAKPQDVGEDQQTEALMVRFRSLYFLAGQSDQAALKSLRETAVKFKDDKRPAVALECSLVLLEKQAAEADLTDAKQAAQLLSDVKETFSKEKKLGERHLELASVAVSLINKISNDLAAAEHYLAFGQMFEASEHADLQRYGRRVSKIGKKLDLLNKPVEITGTLLDGEKFKWSDYKGKIVLIDFWATWCGPCVEELPNVKKNYDEYHEKGFEIIGISLDKDADEVRTFLEKHEVKWKTLFAADEKTQGFNHPMVKKFGVRGIPTMILVGRDGKIAALNARGPKLGEEIERLLKQKAAPVPLPARGVRID